MMSIEKMQPEHWQEVKTIYEEGIKTGNATFETSAPEWEAWDKAHLIFFYETKNKQIGNFS